MEYKFEEGIKHEEEKNYEEAYISFKMCLLQHQQLAQHTEYEVLNSHAFVFTTVLNTRYKIQACLIKCPGPS